MDVSNKKILILGLMRSGIAVAELLLIKGAKLILCDQKDNEKIRENIAHLSGENVIVKLATDPITLLNDVDILLISPGVPIDSPVVLEAKKIGVEVTGEFEVAASFCNNTMLAITGTNGKTTSVSLLGRILENAGKVTWVAGNIGFPLSTAVLNAKQNDIIVNEVSSFQMETAKTFHPAIAAILNISEDHLNRHKTMEEYINQKFKIFQNQTSRDIAVLNYDDEVLREKSKELKSEILWFSRTQELEKGAFVKDDEIYVNFREKLYRVCNVNEIVIPGPHNLENSLAMCAIAIAMNVPTAVIRHTLMTFEGVEHRIETVAVKNGITYINDSKGTNSDSTIKAVHSMKKPTVIILGGYDKHSDFTELCTLINNSLYIKHAVLIGQTAKQFEELFKQIGFNNFTHSDSLESAVLTAQQLCEAGDNVLLSPACASFDMFDDYEHRGKVFKQIVNKL